MLPARHVRDPDRRKRCHVPEGVRFMTETEIALGLIDESDEAGVAYETVLSDAGYSGNQKSLDGLEERREKFVGGIPCDSQVRIPQETEKAAKTHRRMSTRRADPGRSRTRVSLRCAAGWTIPRRACQRVHGRR